MILSKFSEPANEPKGGAFWSSFDCQRVVFCSVHTTGPDPAYDGVFRLQAERRGTEPGCWESFDQVCNPFADHPERWNAEGGARRIATSLREEIQRAPPVAEVWRAFRKFIAGGALVASRIETVDPWLAHFADDPTERALSIGVAEVQSLFYPGRDTARSGAGARIRALGSSPTPAELRGALTEFVQQLFTEDPGFLALAVAGYAHAWRGFSAGAPEAAERLRFALALVDRPSAWCTSDATSRVNLPDGRLREQMDAHDAVDDLLDTLRPRCAVLGADFDAFDTVPVEREEPAPFDPTDAAMLDEVFRTHLAEQFATESSAPLSAGYRSGQHDVARHVAATLGAHEMLLVHAPTGTGKTLAYLVPAILWAVRSNVRVGIATYTRALQDQAMERELPRALAALESAGLGATPRVQRLKGRENYVCWRALKQAVPSASDEGESWLAWTMLALFAATDPEGDLDRLPLRASLPLEASAELQSTLRSLVRDVRAHTACCTHREDRSTCAAELARKRAERSHVVITNQALALHRPELFKHLVFDECEHLHDQALNAFSHTLTLASVRNLLLRLHRPGTGSGSQRSRAVLDKLRKMVIPGSPTWSAIDSARESWGGLTGALARLERALIAFEEWREIELKQRSDRDSHSLLREYAARADSSELRDSRCAFSDHGNGLDAALAAIAERLDEMPLRGVASIRRGLDLARLELTEVLRAIEAWYPLDENGPVFRPSTFYDVERDPKGELALVASVLLPHEYLGSQYYPQLATAIFVSATAWLQESFKPALGYLGLDRAAHPTEHEDRLPCVVRTAREPEVFDYSRVLVAVPRDAPSVTPDKQAFLDYVRRFVAFLGERTRGRMLVLFTNAQDLRQVGEELTGFFRARRIPLLFQNMEGASKEELGDLFRSRADSVLLGVDTFWYGADFPGDTLEYLVIVRLPYGVPDRYHHAQCAAMGAGEQRNRIYLPRAISKFRQGFGRLMRRVGDRGCVFLLDGRVLDARHRMFLRELPLENALARPSEDGVAHSVSRLVRGETSRCVYEALAHMDLVADVARRGLDFEFDGKPADVAHRDEGFGTQYAGRDMPPQAPFRTDAALDRSPRAPLRTDAAVDRSPGAPLRSDPAIDPLPPSTRLDIPLGDVPF